MMRPGTRRHHADAVGQQDRLVDVVGDEQHGGAERLPDVEQELLHGEPGLRVERAERLVHQQRARVHDQDAGDADALAHAARQLRRQGIGERLEPDQLHHVAGLVLVGRARQALHARPERDVVPDGQPREQRRLPGTPRRGRGRAARSRCRRTARSPLVGRSNPATRLSRVDFPQPDGPSRATNSPSPMSRLTSCSARDSDAPANIFEVVRNEIVPIGQAWNDCRRCQPSTQVSSAMIRRSLREAEQADRHHVGDHHIHAADIVGVPQNVAEAGLDRDHLGHDDGGPADAEADAQAGEDRRQRGRHDDARSTSIGSAPIISAARIQFCRCRARPGVALTTIG